MVDLLFSPLYFYCLLQCKNIQYFNKHVYTITDKDDMSDIDSAAFSRYFPYINAVTGRYFAIVFLNSYDITITEKVQRTIFSFTISCMDGRP